MGLDKGGHTGSVSNSTREHHMNIYKQLLMKQLMGPDSCYSRLDMVANSDDDYWQT